MTLWLYQNRTWRDCELEFKRAPSQVRFSFGVLFILCGVVASVGNMLALHYLIKPYSGRTSKEKVFMIQNPLFSIRHYKVRV